ncbi:endopeptidase La [Parasutterella muris]|uniref:Lon protease n=5 Tax=Parasutterella TaxID=577310 RepID=A0A6L6YL88_9BURK|nr:endopeptidase La [Parasutterella muris]MVX57722.1 endopeptidase La [Parasutterella muris]
MRTKIVNLPVLPLRDVVLFPGMVIPLYVGRPKSLDALNKVLRSSKINEEILLVSQKQASTEDPDPEDLNEMGTVARVIQSLKLPDDTQKVLVEGLYRAKVIDYSVDSCIYANVEKVQKSTLSAQKFEPLRRAILSTFTSYQRNNKRISSEQLDKISAIDNASEFADSIAQALVIPPERKQLLLNESGVGERLELLLSILEEEVDIQQTEKRIRGRVKRSMEKSQRDYYLNEQVKAIQKELGETDEEFEEYERKIKEAKMSHEGQEKALAELKKLRMMGQNSAESNVIRNYLDTLIELPWSKKTRINGNMVKAEEVLEEDHYGLEKVKERIIEYLAVQTRVKNVKSPILCLVGPPGVGKTSLGQSIARATGRKFVRLALGGVRDESEIRGHRRTYVGSMPGRILQSLAKSKVNNPLFLLDEVDKMGMDYRGDPAAALLEVLDPEQNNTFQDHYVEVDFDLSHVMFIATSNSMNIPAPLLDRMEVINLSGYTEDEKRNIAERHLIPKQMKLNGVKENELRIEESAIIDIVRYYTREAGVRGLEREINKICRKVVRDFLMKKAKSLQVVNSENLEKYLGVRRYTFGVTHKQNLVGQVTGLAWTEVGGDLLTIEVATMPGKGNITRTGSLGDVMKESVEAARTVLRSRATQLGISYKQVSETDIHVHFPEGAVPKDGPSAGSAITLGLVSAMTGIPVRADVAMTGEITLRGDVLPIGGLKEKLLAALRGGIKEVLIPEENVKDLEEVPANVKEGLVIRPVKTIDEVLSFGLEHLPQPLPATISTDLSAHDLKVPEQTVQPAAARN